MVCIGPPSQVLYLAFILIVLTLPWGRDFGSMLAALDADSDEQATAQA